MSRAFRALALALCLHLTGLAGERPPVFPGARYDASIPTLRDVAGFDFGEQITFHHEAVAYAKTLAAASPKVSLLLRGKSWEGRPMGLLAVTSAANQSRLEEIRNQCQSIADPRVTDEEAFAAVIADMPAVTLLQQSVHGNEISGVDSGLFLAYHLAAALDDDEADRILDDGLLLIEINQNPDGRDRFVQYSRGTATLKGDSDSQAAERREPWPSGRFNHYLFDMNRDWFAMSQVETQTKVASFLAWFPQVTVDLHEMGSESSFFAAAPSQPANPLLPQTMLEAYRTYGKEIAKLFDARGIDYFHSEVFDSFYPGYGESWPSLQGSMGVLFEQASARGLRYQRRDGTVLTYWQTVSNQALASYAVFRHAARNREETLRFFYRNRKQAIAEAEDERQIFLLPGDDPARAVLLGRLLRQQGIEVEQIREPIKNLSARESRNGANRKMDIPAHAILVRLDQPAGRLARTLLLDRIEMNPDFLERQQDLMDKRLGLEIYDITAWSLPLAYGAPIAIAAGSGWRGQGVQELAIPHQTYNLEASVGYLIPNGITLGPALSDLLRQKVRVSYITRGIRHQGLDFPRGSLIVRRAGNPDNLPGAMAKLSADHEITVYGVNTSWFEEGPSFGSDAVVDIQPPNVALLWNTPTNPMSAGWARYIMERQFQYPVTLLRADQIRYYDLSEYDALIMPSGSAGGWSQTFGKSGAERIAAWVEAGGTLIALDATVEWLIQEEVGLLDTVREKRNGFVGEEQEPSPAKPETDPDRMILPRNEYPESAYGAFLRTQFDETHWLSYGMQQTQTVMVHSNRIYRPLRLDSGFNPARFDAPEELLVSGFVPVETLEQFAHKPFLMTARRGRGLVIAFTEDPNFRAFLLGLRPLMRNAVFLGPTQTR